MARAVRCCRQLLGFVIASAVMDVVEVSGIQITALRVPAVVRNGSGLPAILDCEYSLKPDEPGLVVKWFFGSGPFPVYQWIPGQRPQELGILKGRLNLNHKASDNHVTKHRALYIVNPTTDLTGEYKCLVSTFSDEDFMTKKMVVFAQGRGLELRHSKPDPDSVNVSCRAQGVYPEPKIALYKDRDRSTMTNLDGVVVESVSRGGSYDITAYKVLRDEDLQSPTLFDCELRIPDANYRVSKTVVYRTGDFNFFSENGSARHLSRHLVLLSAAAIAALTTWPRC
ncbi:uncharacterized protein LOC134530706 [Bacillus rossius redtenbacheri]|uniref:uncharacterized protein LOC134530706 n=1 Tax=Bacillus rossius redtenbacheri TaxID=93214 RepID=UPI002FDDC805